MVVSATWVSEPAAPQEAEEAGACLRSRPGGWPPSTPGDPHHEPPPPLELVDAPAPSVPPLPPAMLMPKLPPRTGLGLWLWPACRVEAETPLFSTMIILSCTLILPGRSASSVDTLTVLRFLSCAKCCSASNGGSSYSEKVLCSTYVSSGLDAGSRGARTRGIGVIMDDGQGSFVSLTDEMCEVFALRASVLKACARILIHLEQELASLRRRPRSRDPISTLQEVLVPGTGGIRGHCGNTSAPTEVSCPDFKRAESAESAERRLLYGLIAIRADCYRSCPGGLPLAFLTSVAVGRI